MPRALTIMDGTDGAKLNANATKISKVAGVMAMCLFDFHGWRRHLNPL